MNIKTEKASQYLKLKYLFWMSSYITNHIRNYSTIKSFAGFEIMAYL